jgi:hypothetical protein
VTVAKWQAVFSHDFPDGALCEWDAPGSATYRIIHIQVTGMRGLDPIVVLPVFDAEKTLGPWPVLSYEVPQRSPVVQARVTFENVPEAMLWGSGVGAHLAEMMRASG